MRKIQDLTDQDLLEIYNCNFDEQVDLADLEIERSEYGVIEIHQKDCCDDMMLTFSEYGSIYLYCLDNGEIYHDVLNATVLLNKKGIYPFYCNPIPHEK